MNIKDLKLFKKVEKEEKYSLKKNVKAKMGAIALGLGLIVLPVSGCSNVREITPDTQAEIVNEDDIEKVFEPGEHTILETFETDDEKKQRQIDYHEGYEVSNIEVDKYLNCYVLYKNKESVKVKATAYDKNTGELYYEEFGTPIEKDKTLVK